MAARDYYEVLGVSRDSSADELQQAYRRLARPLEGYEELAGAARAGGEANRIVVPRPVNQRERELFEVLATASSFDPKPTMSSYPLSVPARLSWTASPDGRA